jgi:hypothetical protein
MVKQQKYIHTIYTVIFILILSISLPLLSYGKDRCQEYLPDIRAYGIQYNGLDFPWWYNVGCAITETSCRGNLTSFDQRYRIIPIYTEYRCYSYIE